MNISIRPAVAEDAAALSALSMRSKQSNGYDDTFMQACRQELTVTPVQLESGGWWVAESAQSGGDEYCGCVCLRDSLDGTGEVHAFFIDPAWQRRGIGRKLWKKVLECAHAQRITRIILDADPAAVPFYRALGFETIGEKPSGSIVGRMLPHMAISL